MNKMRNLPNFITMLRILGSFSIIFLAPLTREFFIVYTIVGFTDVLDGFIARKTHTTSEFGAKLDSAADILFYSVMVIKIIPHLVKRIETVFWIIAGIVFIIRIFAYMLAFIKFHCFSSLHTYLSKLTGVCVFFMPYFYLTDFLNVFCIVLSVVAIASSVEEVVAHITRKTYRSNIKSVLNKEQKDSLSL